MRHHHDPTSYKYKITIFLNKDKTMGISTISNELTLPTLYDYVYSTYSFIKQRHIENNIWELKFMNVSSKKAEYEYIPIEVKWYLFDEEKSHWVELKKFENKHKIIIDVDLKRKIFKVYNRRLKKDRPWDSWVSGYSDEITIQPRPWFMPNIKNIRANHFPRILSLDLINIKNIKKIIEKNLDRILKDPKNLPIDLISEIKFVFFGEGWKNDIVVINDVECKIEIVDKNNDFIQLEIKVIAINHYIFKNYLSESYSIVIFI